MSVARTKVEKVQHLLVARATPHKENLCPAMRLLLQRQTLQTQLQVLLDADARAKEMQSLAVLE